ncbi:hypothetical protein AB0F16_37580 [Streptomyces tanashiensis]|uniref:hypothetical protein n=1 Tax=Streptomyces tanashiensis TaxID=67367 RepID=UPI0033CF0FF7
MTTETPVVGLTTRPTTGTKPLPPHGSLSRRKHHRCSCVLCVTAYNSYQRSRYRKQGYGTWRPFVNAEPARQHLIALRNAGYSIDVVADAIGQHVGNLNAIVYPVGGAPRQRIRPELADTILAVTAESLVPCFLPAAGTARRIHALIAMGWTSRCVAEQLGVKPPRVPEIARQDSVTRAVAERVAAVYDRLHVLSPEDHGVSATASLRSRLMAERNGWRDPLWWEDMGHIDDPMFDPDTAERPLNKHEQGALRATEILHLASYGATPDEIAARLDLGRDYVVARLRELRRTA